MRITELIKRGYFFFNRNPAYLGFCGALIGVFIGGLLSLYSIKYGKEIDVATSRKNHIEQLYLNLEFSFALFKDKIMRYYMNDYEVFLSEIKIKQYGIKDEIKHFYEDKFTSAIKRIENDDNAFSESMASFYRDYKALKLYIDLQSFDKYFVSTFDSCILVQIDYLKKTPPEILNSFDEEQNDSVHNLLDISILKVNQNSDSVFALIHKQVSVEINK